MRLTNDQVLAIKRESGLARNGIEYGGTPGGTIQLIEGTAAPTAPPTSTALDRLRSDARRLKLLHDGDVFRLRADPRLNLAEFASVSNARIDAELTRAGQRPTGRTRGIHKVNADGSHVVLVADRCPPAERLRTLLHELGHVRAVQLESDHSELAARVWQRAWIES